MFIYGLLHRQRRMQHGTKAAPAVNIVPLEAPIASTKEIEVSADPAALLRLCAPEEGPCRDRCHDRRYCPSVKHAGKVLAPMHNVFQLSHGEETAGRYRCKAISCVKRRGW